MTKSLFYCLFLTTLLSCKESSQNYLFESLDTSQTGIDFLNRIEDTPEMNIINYRNFYNGAGVAIGDVNNDGFADIYLTANQGENKLYLNKGKKEGDSFQFEDITKQAGVSGTKAWSTGVTFADVNGDGLLDIYVCNSGELRNDTRGNELFINQGIGQNGIPSFKEMAVEYGLFDGGYSTHAAFFDYDRDGDLDMYLLNNSFIQVNKLQYQNLRNQRDPFGGHKLLRNDNNKFTDVSQQAGIYGSLIGFGLGITVGDVNNDNWLDIYISNDFYERDYLYINQKNGTFKEVVEESMGHTSLNSMGADIGDINNDGQADIFVTDMLPNDDYRLKTTSSFETYELEQIKVQRDFYHQYTRNTLQLNNGDNHDGIPVFSEIAALSGVYSTDWSWGALIFDMDNDGKKDIFVANGIIHDLTDQDFISFLADKNTVPQMLDQNGRLNINKMVEKMPSQPLPNYAFQNQGNLKFENKAIDWGLGEPGFSNGAAYGDLDNDGDLDLIINNNNMPLSVYRNNSSEKLKKHFLRVNLKGADKNAFGIGAKVFLYQQGRIQYLQSMPNHGFQSSSDHILVFGLDKNPVIDSLTVIWQNDKKQTIKNPKADTDLVLEQKNADQLYSYRPLANSKYFTDITSQSGLNYTHIENEFVDYNRDATLKQMFSRQGPALAAGDVNGDGLDDVYLGAAFNSVGQLFLQTHSGNFQASRQSVFVTNAHADEVAATFFDADGDKDLDLYVATGGNEFLKNNPLITDYLYINDGKGNFSLGSLSAFFENNSCVIAADFDKDGDEDLFVGSRMVSAQYGKSPESYILRNDGKGKFIAESLGELGMITDAAWTDLDKDGWQDLVLAGDWMPVTILKNQKGRISPVATPIPDSAGWWNTIKVADIDNDGDDDLIVGNLGFNSKLTASREHPAMLCVNDFDKNGLVEQLICVYNNGKLVPLMQKPDLQRVIPSIKERFVYHKDYANKSVDEIFTSVQKEGMIEKTVVNPQTSFFINDGKGNFNIVPLPIEVQFSPVYGIETCDYDHDNNLDIILTGNFFDVLPEIGRYDSNHGLVLHGKGQGQFEVLKSKDTGFFSNGQVRRMKLIKGAKKNILILAKNNDKVQVIGF
ncbi:VCBS repeat-containing protein [Emticicia sp. BO119]|uniref:VCBS repeat-containing protein n=1 Tax=Emticicia sp. BO119 TaxID=2757768 RepID=UPI0015F0F798|nr:VCBS repeat-containing protein [Emticicia sp. BO119]MBA4853723.1 VCBS repeat-containing protein [Emticicia sp. BO119]